MTLVVMCRAETRYGLAQTRWEGLRGPGLGVLQLRTAARWEGLRHSTGAPDHEDTDDNDDDDDDDD